MLAWLGPHAGWLALAGIGLVAVAFAAITVRRPPKGMLPLGEATTELRELPPATIAPPAIGEPAPEPAVHAAMEEPQPADAAAFAVASEAPVAARRRAAPPVPEREPPPPLRDDGSQLFLALHHVDLSIDVLRRHIAGEKRPMPAVWLMLLDLARTHSREQTFRELAAEFHRRFNACAPAWDSFPPARDEPGLEAYPRLVKEITRAWGTHECRRLLDRLLYDNRGGNRRGFTLNAYNDLIALRRAADAVIDTIEQDLAEEAKVRSAFASASAQAEAEEAATAGQASPLVRDLENQLDSDLRAADAPASALEREHPALAGMLAREWGNAALSARLCEMLARGGDGAHALSPEAAEELALLRAMAARLAKMNDLSVALDESDAPADAAR